MNMKLIKKSQKRLEHYLREKELAQELLKSSRENRQEIFNSAYREIFTRFSPDAHCTEPLDITQTKLPRRYLLVDALIGSNLRVLEIGCGRGLLISHLSKRNAYCLGTDVSELQIQHLNTLASGSLAFRVMDGINIDVPASSFDFVISTGVVEYFHPDDIELHLASVYRSLVKGGQYIFDTCNRLSGPHDISRGFDEVATGFHLKEYTYSELVHLLHNAGFSKVEAYLLDRRFFQLFPILVARWARYAVCSANIKLSLERIALRITNRTLRRFYCMLAQVDGVFLIATKE